jgi:hypothetical protein
MSVSDEVTIRQDSRIGRAEGRARRVNYRDVVHQKKCTPGSRSAAADEAIS